MRHKLPRRRGQPQPLRDRIRRDRINMSLLARESGFSRRHIYHVRDGSVEPSLECAVAITEAYRRIKGDHSLQVSDLFETPAKKQRAS